MKNQRVALLHWLLIVAVLLLGACKKSVPPIYEEKKIIAETLLDSISNLLIQDPESVIALSDSILKIAVELNDDSLKCAALIEKGGVYIELGNTFAFDSCLHAALAIQFEGSELLHAETYTILADNYNIQGDYTTALQLAQKADSLIHIGEWSSSATLIQYKVSLLKGFAFFGLHQNDSMQCYMDEALSLARELDVENNILFVYSYLGYFYFQLSDIPSAEKYLLEAYEWSKKANNYDAMSSMLYSLSSTAIGQEKYDKSIEYCQEALRIESEQMKTESKMPYIYANMAETYYYTQEYEKAIENAEKSLSFPQLDTMQMAATYAVLSQTYLMMDDFSAALNHAQTALNLMGENSTDWMKKEAIFRTISNSYEKLRDYHNALKYAKLSSVARDSVLSKEGYGVIQELQAKYEAEKKDLDLQAATLTIESQKQRNRWLTVLFTLLLVFLAFYFYHYRKNLKSQILLAEQGSKVANLTSRTLTPNCGNDNNANGLSDEKTNEILRRLRECMEEKKMFKNPTLTLDTLAEELGTNRSYLSIVINSRMQKGFTEYVNFYRVEEAKKLLRNTDNKVAYISAEAGFGSPQTFYSIFKSVVQLTPTEYRKTQKK